MTVKSFASHVSVRSGRPKFSQSRRKFRSPWARASETWPLALLECKIQNYTPRPQHGHFAKAGIWRDFRALLSWASNYLTGTALAMSALVGGGGAVNHSACILAVSVVAGGSHQYSTHERTHGEGIGTKQHCRPPSLSPNFFSSSPSFLPAHFSQVVTPLPVLTD